MSGLAAVGAAGDGGPPVAITFHALGSEKRRHQADSDTSPSSRLRIERDVADAADRIIATATQEVVELRRMGVRDTRISVVPCGVDTAQFRPDGRVAQRTGPHRFRLLSIGRLVPRKGVDDAIRVVAQLPGCELVIAGGPDATALGEDPEVMRLRHLAGSLGVRDRVRFVGAVARRDVPALIRSADVVLCLPWYEPFGIVPLEALACGRPVVGSRVGGLLDTLEEGRTGFLVPPRDPDAAARAVSRLLAAPGLRRSIGHRGPRRMAERYDWNRVAEATEQVYVEMLADTRRGAGSLPAASGVGLASGVSR
jgi:glycosyltransferase involved in cell wall biosynthesis